MGQILHKRATTTHAIRKQIKEAKGSLNDLAERFHVNWKTIQKWKKREGVEDAPMGNGRMNSVITPEEEHFICETRRLTWLPLDDLFDLLKPQIPKLSRSNLHRCLQYNNISRVPVEISEKPKAQKFKLYELGFLHIDFTEFWLCGEKVYLFVAIDRITKLTFAEAYKHCTIPESVDFLQKVIKFFPYKIHRILTDNGAQFSYSCQPAYQRPHKRHPFEILCFQQGIKHKLTKFFSPKTNGQVEKMNDIIKKATIKFVQYDSILEFKRHLLTFLDWYNCAKKLTALRRKTPYEAVIYWYNLKPKLFHKNPLHHCVGLNS
jgi:transposase InsO family protein